MGKVSLENSELQAYWNVSSGFELKTLAEFQQGYTDNLILSASRWVAHQVGRAPTRENSYPWGEKHSYVFFKLSSAK